MAFTVTPTSGDAPYEFTASYENLLGVNLGLYVAEFRSITGTGSCPTPDSTGTNNPANANQLLTTGSTSSVASVPAGSCRTFVNLIRRVSDNVVVSQMSVNVNNV